MDDTEIIDTIVALPASTGTEEGLHSTCSLTPSKKAVKEIEKIKDIEKNEKVHKTTEKRRVNSKIKGQSSVRKQAELKVMPRKSREIRECDINDSEKTFSSQLHRKSYESSTEKLLHNTPLDSMSQKSRQEATEKFPSQQNEHFETEKLKNEFEKMKKDLKKDETENKQQRSDRSGREANSKSTIPQCFEDRSRLKQNRTMETDTSTQLSMLTKELDVLKGENSILTKMYNEELKCKLKLQRENSKLEEERQELSLENNVVTVKYDKEHKCVMKLQEENSKLNKECEKLKHENNEVSRKYDGEKKLMMKLQEEHLELDDECEKLKRDNSEWTRKYDEVHKCMTKLQKEISKLNEECDKRKCENSMVLLEKKEVEEKYHYTEELTVSPNKIGLPLDKEISEEGGSKLRVQVYCKERNDLTDTIIEDFAALLKTKLSSDDLELEILCNSNVTEVAPEKLLFVLCTSIIASDSYVQKALTGIDATDLTAILMIHLKEPHALPSVSSERKLAGSVRTGLGGIFDMAYLRDRGLYACPMNERNIEDIVNFIKAACMKEQACTSF